MRRAAMDWLALRTSDGLESIDSESLREFTFEGERLPLIDAQRGIRKPASLSAALSIRTVYRAEGASRPYEDAVGKDGLLRYKWRGDDGDHAENRALRSAMRQRLPLIWFVGVGGARYQAVYPIYLLDEEPAQQQFVVAVGEGFADLRVQGTSPVEEHLRRYVVRETRQRLHQPVFRATVMRAYGTRCSVCSLAHGQLLDAAHIVPDVHELGSASVVNGLALCKIHHAAFDANILGVRPDLVVEIRRDLLDEIDGPMLRHGLQERHGQRLMVLPQARQERPDHKRLELRYEEFRTAS
ncbi:MAG: HNH endonuclease [Actinomycetales bacterium]